MKAIFGVVSLLVVLAIVGVLASRQMKAVSSVPVTASQTGEAPTGNVREQSQQVQDKVRSDMTQALEQGAARREEADK
jgi:hypothetical protein